MGNIFKIFIITSPVLAVLVFLLIMYSNKHEVEFKKQDIKFEADWDAFEQTFDNKTYKIKQKILEQKKKELETLKKKEIETEKEKNKFFDEFKKEMKNLEDEFKKKIEDEHFLDKQNLK